MGWEEEEVNEPLLLPYLSGLEIQAGALSLSESDAVEFKLTAFIDVRNFLSATTLQFSAKRRPHK
jgi:hypothetical protein